MIYSWLYLDLNNWGASLVIPNYDLYWTEYQVLMIVKFSKDFIVNNDFYQITQFWFYEVRYNMVLLSR